MLTNKQVLSIATNILYLDDFKLATLQDTEGVDWLDSFQSNLSDDDYKMIALMIHTKCEYDNLPINDYKVYDTLEKDEALEEYAERYYYDDILPEIPEYLHRYFDEISWKEDFIEEIDPGIALSCDECENEVYLFNTPFYIYRI